ncbi:MAG: hypothetical protein KIT22_12085, partial [Verrucomicrobiae bacterium]|nr:hypothetical protein [Verrucomicrobiae bacterium]
RYVFFVSDASNLVTNDWNGAGLDLFRRDRVTGETLLVSVALDAGAGANGSVLEYAVSSDGNRVVWTSDASNLVPGDTNEAADVFLRDINAGTTTLVSWNLEHTGPGRGDSSSPTISADGRRVIYITPAENVETGEPPPSGERLCLRDLETQSVTVICDEPWGFEANADADLVVYFTSKPLEDFQSSGIPTPLMVWRASTGLTERLWLPVQTSAPLYPLKFLSRFFMTPSGSHLVFSIPVEVTGANMPIRGLWRVDLRTGTFLKFWESDELQFLDYPQWISITDDGTRIAFIVPADNPDQGQVRVWTEGVGSQSLADLVSPGPASSPPPEAVEGLQLSPEGSHLVYFTPESVPEAGVNEPGISRAYLRTLTNGVTRNIALAEGDLEAAFDPTGEWLAYTVSEPWTGGDDWQEQSSIFVLGPSDAPPVRISEALPHEPSPVASATVARAIGLSDDGRQILFRGHAPDLFPGADTRFLSYFCFDVPAGTNRWIDGPVAGMPDEPGTRTLFAALAANGSAVSFETSATNLPQSSEFGRNILLRNITSGESLLASPGFFGSHAFVFLSSGSPPQISGDGRRVHLRWDGSPPLPRPALFDQRKGYIDDLRFPGGGSSPVSSPYSKTVLSSDGQRIGYVLSGMAGWVDLRRGEDFATSNPDFGPTATPLHVEDQVDRVIIKAREAYIGPWSVSEARDPSKGSRVLVSASDLSIGVPRVSAGGSLVVFSGRSLAPGGGTGPRQIFAKAVDGGPAELISIGLDGGLANGDCRPPQVSADGRFVVFASMASNLVAGDTNGFADVFVRDRYAGVTHLLSRLADGSQEDGHCAGAMISGDGRTAAFTSFGRRLIPGDTSREPTLVYTSIPQSAPVDSDGDGLPDTWERDHFAGLSEGPDGDPDADGQSNHDEYLARTSPVEAASRLEMTTVEAIAGELEVSWLGHAGVSYQLEQRPSLTSETSWAPVGTPQPGYEGLIHQTVPGADLGALYRVTVVAP